MVQPLSAVFTTGQYESVGSTNYTPEDVQRFFYTSAPDGVIEGEGDELEVVAHEDLTIRIKSGAGLVDGSFFLDGLETEITLDDADTSDDRYDRVILALNRTGSTVTYSSGDVEDDTIDIAVLKGTPGSGVPSLTQNVHVQWEMPLATVLVEANAETVESFHITDERPFTSWRRVEVILVDLIAGENLSGGEAVRLGVNGASTDTPGRVYKMDRDAAATSSEAWALGVVVGPSTMNFYAGYTVPVAIIGRVQQYSGLTPGALQYTSSTAGALVESSGGTAPRLVAVALDANTIVLNTQSYNAAVGIGGKYGYFWMPHSSTASLASGYRLTQTDRLDFDAETDSTLSGSPIVSAYYYGIVTTGQEYIYLAGGLQGGTGSSPDSRTNELTQRWDLSDETFKAAPTATLNTPRYGSAGLSNRLDAGYVLGGLWWVDGNSIQEDLIERLAFASEVFRSLAARLGRGSSGLGHLNEGSKQGYVYGGIGPGGNRSDASKFKYASDTVVVLNVNLDGQWRQTAGLSNAGTAGYVCGGGEGTRNTDYVTDTVSKITYATDTKSSVSAMPVAGTPYSGVSEGETAGYIMGGNYDTGGRYTQPQDDIYKLPFGTETWATNPGGGTLTQDTNYRDAASDIGV